MTVTAADVGVEGAAVPRAVGLSVLGNTLAGRGQRAGGGRRCRGDCLFSDNRCELRGGTGPIAVSMAARSAIVNANRVSGGEASVMLQVNAKLITVLGNITSAGIVTSARLPSTWTALGGPWEPLNIRA